MRLLHESLIAQRSEFNQQWWKIVGVFYVMEQFLGTCNATEAHSRYLDHIVTMKGKRVIFAISSVHITSLQAYSAQRGY